MFDAGNPNPGGTFGENPVGQAVYDQWLASHPRSGIRDAFNQMDPTMANLEQNGVTRAVGQSRKAFMQDQANYTPDIWQQAQTNAGEAANGQTAVLDTAARLARKNGWDVNAVLDQVMAAGNFDAATGGMGSTPGPQSWDPNNFGKPGYGSTSNPDVIAWYNSKGTDYWQQLRDKQMTDAGYAQQNGSWGIQGSNGAFLSPFQAERMGQGPAFAQNPNTPAYPATPGAPGAGQGPTNDPNGPQNQPQTGTPQAAAAAGRTPEKHGAYWSAQGWNQNAATGVWTGPGGQTWDPAAAAQPVPGTQPAPGPTGQPNAPTPQPGGPTTTVPGQQVPAATATSPTMPLDPQYEAQRRMAEDQLQAALAPISSGRESLNAQEQLQLARMGTQSTYDQQAIRDAMGARGMLSSSIYSNALGQLGTQQLRDKQDLASSIASALGGLSTDQANAQLTYNQALEEAMLALQNRLEGDPNAAVLANPSGPSLRTGRRKPRKRKGR